ncbi:hypothetical protein CHH48_02410 [Terribacillus saccharophilus]|uniref:DNA-binding protein n=1 Tax=Terribacillus saccharophilus TaxID=361277 RepID=A0ABX4H396_9BACI|nr:hypothetical protein CHH56_01710 [Terribacillus saccharophilus]PAD97571.1 hypothetical protein CHH50_02415 [Terribacillus saccharophilus]PAE01618.1 hypothetical protein CHH48_02410 [Terribacillus saccharophilus]
MYTFDNKEQLIEFIQKDVLTSSEALEFLRITRSRLSQLLKNEKIVPNVPGKIVCSFAKIWRNEKLYKRNKQRIIARMTKKMGEVI